MTLLSRYRWLHSFLRPRVKAIRKPRRRRNMRLEELEPRITPSQAQTFVWSGADVSQGNNNWSDGNNWVGGVAPSGAAEQDGSFDNLVFDATGNAKGVAVLTNNDLVGATFNSITIGQTGYTLSGNQIQLGDPNTIGGGYVLLNAGQFTDTIAIAMTLGGPAGDQQFFTVNSGGSLTISGPLTGSTGSELTKEGVGTLTLSADNSNFTGPIFVDNSAGILAITNADALGNATNPENVTIIGTNAQLQVINVSGPIPEPLTLNGPGPQNDGALLNVSGNNTWAGNITLDSDSYIGATAGSLTITGSIGDTGAGHNLNKEGPGMVVFATANTYRGQTTIDNGVLRIEDPQALGLLSNTDDTPATGTLVNSTLQGHGTLQLFDPNFATDGGGFVVQNEQLTLNGAGFNGLGALDNLQGDNSWTGDVWLGSPSPNGSDVTIRVDAHNTGGRTWPFGAFQPWNLLIGVVPGDPGPGIVSDPNGPFNLTKSGPGRLIFNTSNTYHGATDIAQGALQVRDSQALGAFGKTAAVTVEPFAALELAVDALPDSKTGTTNTMAFNYNLTINGRGIYNDDADFTPNSWSGALDNISGINEWLSAITLGESAGTDAIGVDPDPNPSADKSYFPTYATVGGISVPVSGDYSLTVTGTIQDVPGGGDSDLAKVGTGQLILLPSAPGGNTYTGNTSIEQGWVTIQADSALGAVRASVSETAQPFLRVLAGAALNLLAPNGSAGFTSDRHMILAGTGLQNAATTPQVLLNGGAIESIGGKNTLTGDIFLNGSDGIGSEDIGIYPNPANPSLPAPTDLTLTGSIADQSTLLSPLQDPGFTVGNIGIGSASDSGIGTIPNTIETGSTSGSIVLHYGGALTSLQVYYGPRGTPGSVLLATFSGTGTSTVTYGGGTSTQIELVASGPFPGWFYIATFNATTSPGGIVKLGSQRVSIQGAASSYTGPVDVVDGVLRDQSNTGLGAPNNTTVTVENGAALEFAQTIAQYNGGMVEGVQTWGRTLVLNGMGDTSIINPDSTSTVVNGAYTPFNDAAVTSLNGDNMWRGPATLASNTAIDVNGGSRLTLFGAIDDQPNSNGSSLTVERIDHGITGDTGELVLAGTNTYRGDTKINQGFITLESSSALGAPTGSLNPGEGQVIVANTAQMQVIGNITIAGKVLTIQGTGVGSIPQQLPVTWFATGPAPIGNGQQTGNLASAGRVTGVATDPTDPNLIYITTADGGVWKTKNNGLTWQSLTDNILNSVGSSLEIAGQPVPLVTGGIVIDPNNPHNIYVATGESNFSNDSYAGVGILYSPDSGIHWQLIQGTTADPTAFVGYVISKMVLSPVNSLGFDFLYVAVSSAPFALQAVGVQGSEGIWKLNLATLTPGTGSTVDGIALSQTVSQYRITQDSASKLYGPGPDDDLSANFYRSGDQGYTGTQAPTSNNINGNFVDTVAYTDLSVMWDPSNYYTQAPGYYPSGAREPPNVFIAFAQASPDGGFEYTDSGGAEHFANAVYVSTDDGGYNVDGSATYMEGAYSGKNWLEAGFTVTDQNTVNGTTVYNAHAGVIKFGASATPLFLPQYPTVPPFGQYDLYAAVTYAGVTDANIQTYAGSWNTTWNGPFNSTNAHAEYQLKEMDHVSIKFSTSDFLYHVGTWGSITTPPQTESFPANANNPNDLTNIAEGDFAMSVLVDPNFIINENGATNNVIYLAGIDEPYTPGPLMSVDSGTSWTDLGVGKTGDPGINAHQLYLDPNDNLLVATDNGLWRLSFTTPGQVPQNIIWSDLNGDLATLQLNSIATNPNVIDSALAGSQGNGVELFGNSPTWNETMPGDGGQVAIDQQAPGTMYAVDNGYLQKSTNGGKSWSPIMQVTWNTDPTAINYPFPQFPDTLGSPPDDGRPFEIFPPNYPGGPWIGEANQVYFPFVLDPIKDQRLVVGAAPGQSPVASISGTTLIPAATNLWETLNGGTSWIDIGGALVDALGNPINVTAIALAQYQGQFVADPRFPLVKDVGNNTYDQKTIYATDGTTVYVTKNEGLSWVATAAGTWASEGGTVQQMEVDPRNRDTVFVVINGLAGTGVSNRVYMTTDAGQHWSPIGTAGGLPDLPTWTVAFDPRTADVYIGNDEGVYVLQGVAPTGKDYQVNTAGAWKAFGNNGSTLAEGLPNVSVRQLILSQSQNTLTAATYGRGMFQLFLNSEVPNTGGIRAAAGSLIWNGPIHLAGPLTIAADGTQVIQNGVAQALINIVGVIDDGASPNPSADQITKIGLGTVIFSGANTYAGLTWVQQGVLVVNNPSALGLPSPGNPGMGTWVIPFVPNVPNYPYSTVLQAQLQLQTNLDLEPLFLYGDGIPFNGVNTGALRNVSNNNTFTGTIDLLTDPVVNGQPGKQTTVTIGVDTGSSLVINSAASPTQAITQGSWDAKNQKISTSGNSVGPATLVKEETGKLTLLNGDAYTGGTDVNQGILNIQNSNALGTAMATTIVFNGAQLQMQANSTSGNVLVPATQTLDVSGTGINGTGALEGLGGADHWFGSVLLDQWVPSYFKLLISPPIPPTQVAFGVLNTGPNDRLVIDGAISQAPPNPNNLDSGGNPLPLATTQMGLTKVGTGMLALNDNNNTYTGLTTVAAGVLDVQKSHALGATTNGTVVNSGAALWLDGDPTGVGASITVANEALTINGTGLPTGTANFTANAGALENVSGINTWTGPVTLGTPGTTLQTDSIGADTNTQLTLTGVIQDPAPVPVPPANFTKVGTGTVVLTGTNTYTGLTTVANGILNIRNKQALGAVADEQQVLTVSGPQTGTYTLQFVYQGKTATTTPIKPGGSTGASVANAINTALSAAGITPVGVNGVSVSPSGASSVFTIIFNGSILSGNLLPVMTVPATSGGTSATVKITVDGSQGEIVNSGATLQLQGGITVASRSTANLPVKTLTINGMGYNGIGALATASSSNHWNNFVTLGSNASVGSDTAADTLFIDQPISDNGNAFGVTKVGLGIVQYDAASSNAYTGLTQVNDGVLRLNMGIGATGVVGNLTIGDATPGAINTDVVQLLGNNQINSTSSLVTINSDGKFDLNNHTQTVSDLVMNGGHVSLPTVGSILTLGTSVSGPVLTASTDAAGNPALVNGLGSLSLGGINQTFQVNGSELQPPQTAAPDMIIASPIVPTGSEGFTKMGAGTLQLTAQSTFMGALSIQQGTVQVEDTNAPTVANVSMNGGTLAGQGIVGTITSASGGGYVMPGDSVNNVGVLTTQTTTGDTWNAATNFFVTLNDPSSQSGFDTLDVNGTLNINGATLTGLVGPNVKIGDSFVIIQETNPNAGRILGTFAAPQSPGVVFISGEKFDVTYTSTQVILQRTKVDSTIVVVSSTSGTSVYGQDVYFTATVTPEPGGGPIPTDNTTVTFTLTGNGLNITKSFFLTPGEVNQATGVATVTYDPLSDSNTLLQVTPNGSPYDITAAFSGDANFNPSNPPGSTGQVVKKASTSIIVSSTPAVTSSSPVYGQTVTVSAQVVPVPPGGQAAVSQLPSGTATFTIDGGALPTQQATLNAAGVASIQLSTLPSNLLTATTHRIDVSYSGDGNYLNTQTTQSFLLTIQPDGTTITVTSLPASPYFGQTATLSATIQAASPGSGTPTGTVQFWDGPANTGTFLGSGTLSNGAASIQASNLATGQHTITVSYSGDPNFNPGTGTLPLTVQPAVTQVTVTPNPNPQLVTKPVTFTATVSVVPNEGTGTPQGTVSFVIDGTSRGTVTLNNGTAAFTISNLTVGAHTVVAQYTPSNNNFAPVNSQPLTENIDSSSSTKLLSSANPGTFGQSLTFTAIVSPVPAGTGTPTGTAQFWVDGTDDANVILANGQAQWTPTPTTLLSAGVHSVYVVYQPDSASFYFTSTSPTLSETINKAATTTTVNSSTDGLSVYGQPVTFTATVASVTPNIGTPQGTVNFYVDGVLKATGVALNSGQATYTTSALTVTTPTTGPHKITAVYVIGTGSNFLASNSTASPVPQSVSKASTSTTVSSSSPTSLVGQAVTFTADVTAKDPSMATPAGYVQFLVNGSVKATVLLNSSGQATWTTSSLGSKTTTVNYTIEAKYLGNGNFVGSLATTDQTVSPPGTTPSGTTISSSANQNTSVYGQSVNYTATVTSSFGNPTGTVTFFVTTNGGAPVAMATIGLTSGQAVWTNSTLTVGTHTIKAQYNGDLTFAPSSQSLVQTVQKDQTNTTITGTTQTAIVGEAVTFTANVAPSGGATGTPTGTVTFYLSSNGGPPVAMATVGVGGDGNASWTISTLRLGNYTVTARYNGSSLFAVSTTSEGWSLSVVNSGSAATTLTLNSSINPSLLHQAVTFSAQLTGSGDLPAPTGQITFYVDGVPKATINVPTNGQVSWTTTSLTVSTTGHSVYARYSGDLTYKSNQSNIIRQVVQNTASVAGVVATTVSNDGTVFSVMATAVDAQGNLVTNYTGLGTLEIVAGGGPVGGSLIGQLTVNFVNGVANWSNISVNIPGDYHVEVVTGPFTSNVLDEPLGGRVR